MKAVGWCQELWWSDRINHSKFPVGEFSPENAKGHAIAYKTMEHDPHHPEVVGSYESFKGDLFQQLTKIHDSGLLIVGVNDSGNYESSAIMLNDIREKRLNFFQTEHSQSGEGHLPADHPLSFCVETAYGLLVWNDIFRIVHDVYAHGQGHSFSPLGEHSAWLAHRSTLRRESHLALWCETKGQNSWINFGEHVDPSQPLGERSFAEQKSGVVGAEFY